VQPHRFPRKLCSRPAKVNVDEVGVTLLVGLCQILQQAYGESFGATNYSAYRISPRTGFMVMVVGQLTE
jgi:hypothetical protein